MRSLPSQIRHLTHHLGLEADDKVGGSQTFVQEKRHFLMVMVSYKTCSFLLCHAARIPVGVLACSNRAMAGHDSAWQGAY